MKKEFKTYTKEQIENLPGYNYKTDQGEFDSILLCPTDQTIDGYPAFYVVGCNNHIPVKILHQVHGFSWDFLIDPIATEIKCHMRGDGIFQFWSKHYKMVVNLVGEDFDIELKSR